jgi:type II restriction enzyme
MALTAKQALGRKGEDAVRERTACPRCRRTKTLTGLPANFQCADLICKFCGFLAQVKSVTISGDERPLRVLGAAWGPQHEQILDGIFQPLYIVGFSSTGTLVRIDYVPAHILQSSPQAFEPRAPLSSTARRAGWQGFVYNLARVPEIGITRIYP